MHARHHGAEVNRLLNVLALNVINTGLWRIQPYTHVHAVRHLQTGSDTGNTTSIYLEVGTLGTHRHTGTNKTSYIKHTVTHACIKVRGELSEIPGQSLST